MVRRIKLFEEFAAEGDSPFIHYAVRPDQEVIIRNDSMGREDLKINPCPLKEMLGKMGGVSSIGTDFPTKKYGMKPFPIDFAMNACLYKKTPSGENVGLFIFYKNPIIPNVNPSLEGNFGMHCDENTAEVNGVLFGGGEDKWSIIGSSQWKFDPRNPPEFAIQTGPVLVMDGKINTAFKADSPNRSIRNGVGVDDDGNLHFVISTSGVTFYEIASFFNDVASCPDALYCDGVISQAYNKGKYVGNLNQDVAPVFLVVK